MKRCPDCRAPILLVQGEHGEIALDVDPAPDGHVIFEQAQTASGDVLGARRARFLRDGEPLKPGTTRYAWHGWSCKAKRKRQQRPDVDQGALWSPTKESA